MAIFNVNDALSRAKSDISNLLLKDKVTDEEAQRIIRRYTAAIEGNFVSWMGTAAITARSVEGRYAASENLWVEMKDDHAGMLRAFAKNANAEPQTEDYQYVAETVGSIRSMVAEMSGLKNLTLMAVLENTSAEFIPWLEKLAVQLGATDLTYTKVHGEADIMHADQFAWAVEHEVKHYENGEGKVSDVVQTTLAFLKTLFV